METPDPSLQKRHMQSIYKGYEEHGQLYGMSRSTGGAQIKKCYQVQNCKYADEMGWIMKGLTASSNLLPYLFAILCYPYLMAWLCYGDLFWGVLLDSLASDDMSNVCVNIGKLCVCACVCVRVCV